MNGYKRIFLDTSPIVYYLEYNEVFYAKVKNFWKEHEYSDYVTSTVTVTEYLTYPYQKRNEKQIRAEYTAFRTMDALQLASACLSGCDLFLTNDKQLKQFREITCITVEEL